MGADGGCWKLWTGEIVALTSSWQCECSGPMESGELRGRMFFSSSSVLLGRFPSLMFRVSRRRIFMARAPGTKTRH
ncbi:hypothetical protein EYF80_010340 [Liparis tanakae]|uniref:Uncharacterized protein n=1 Tax=Liparis tanakae TaxID=230148 RepID=A0A4Z2IQT1_9TELE|nr:hypothetical protein EYF80_010340 [Liparis tanakae]